MNGDDSMSDFNKIIAFQQMMPYLSKEQQEELALTLGMDLQEIERRLVGKKLYLSEQRQPWKEIIYLQQSEGMQRS